MFTSMFNLAKFAQWLLSRADISDIEIQYKNPYQYLMRFHVYKDFEDFTVEMLFDDGGVIKFKVTDWDLFYEDFDAEFLSELDYEPEELPFEYFDQRFGE